VLSMVLSNSCNGDAKLIQDSSLFLPIFYGGLNTDRRRQQAFRRFLQASATFKIRSIGSLTTPPNTAVLNDLLLTELNCSTLHEQE